MAESFAFELVTPEQLTLQTQATMVEVPGEEGDFGVLSGHAPLISMIRPGVVAVHREHQEMKRYFVPSGYAEVTPERCVVLAEYAEDLAVTSRADVEQRLHAAKRALDIATTEEARMDAEKTMLYAENLLLTLNQ